jgi:guanine nucleotide-binding protein alpha-1 subunit
MVSYGDRPNDYDSVSKCKHLRHFFFPNSLILVTDFKNKFAAIHHSVTPNKERELYSEFYSKWPHNLAERFLVHLTSVTDTRRTATIIGDGESTFQQYISDFPTLIDFYLVRDIIIKSNLRNLKLV